MNTCSFVKTYHNDECNYICKCTNQENGSRIKEEYFQNNNIKEAIYKEYHSNGNIRIECNYINGKKMDEYIKYYYTGRKFIECYYINDKIDGELKIYKENGELSSIIIHNNGKKIRHDNN